MSDNEARRVFGVCPGARYGGEGVRGDLVGYLQRKLSDIAELDYPYAVNFTGLVLPGHPVRRPCMMRVVAYKARVSRIVNGNVRNSNEMGWTGPSLNPLTAPPSTLSHLLSHSLSHRLTMHTGTPAMS